MKNVKWVISVGVLGLVLADPLKTYDERKGFFISHCGNFAKVFKSMYNLRQNESYVLNLLGGLKFLREEKEHRDREESVNNNNNNNYSNNTFEEKICLVLEDLDTFGNFCKKLHNISH